MTISEKFLPLSLSDKDCALIANRLEAPVVVAQIIHGETSWDSASRYTLHELLSEMQPDAALLSLAFGALHISLSHAQASAAMGAFSIECRRVIGEYGPLWLNQDADKADSREAAETLERIGEDLECFAELLELNIEYLRAKEPVAAEIFEIFLVQARAHVLIAETFIDVVTYAASADDERALPTPPLASASEEMHGMKAVIAHRMLTKPQSQACNVILFPISRKT